jgi:glycosyltransferase
MPDPKRVAIVIPSFRDIRILRAISSIERSDPGNLSRIYVIDGGSNQEIVSSIRNSLRPQDILVSEPDKGIFDALNKGIGLSTEEVIGWLGADDYFTDFVRFADIVDCFDRLQLDCYIFPTMFSDDKVIRRVTPAVNPSLGNYRLGRLVPHFSSFWSRKTIGSLRYSLDYPNAADQKFFISLAARGNLRAHLDRRVGTVMRLGGASTGHFSRVLKGNLDTFAIYREYMGSISALVAVFLKMAWKTIDTCIRMPLRSPPAS